MLLTTYPGVYLQELPSGNHTVTPVATNVAAFVGRAPVGPTAQESPHLRTTRFAGGLEAL